MEHARASWRKYNKTGPGRRRKHAYSTSPKGRAVAAKGTKKYRATANGWQKFRATLKKYDLSPKGRAKAVRAHLKRKSAVVGDLTGAEWAEILRRHRGRCVYCGSTERIEMDHVVPISRGGAHTKGNVVPACRTCNRRKHAKPVDVFLSRGVITA